MSENEQSGARTPRDPLEPPKCRTFRYANDAFRAVNLMHSELSQAETEMPELEERADQLLEDLTEMFEKLADERGLSDEERGSVWMGDYKEVFADGE